MSDEVIVAPFTIEAGTPRNNDLILAGIPGCRLRGTINPTTTTVDGKVRALTVQQQSPPTLPGQHLAVNPGKLSYVITDPLCDDEPALLRLKQFLKITQGIEASDMHGVPRQTGTLDKHRMKTLVRELCRIVAEGNARVVKGALPTPEQVDALPGEYLLDPGAQVRTGRPRFEKDLESWEDRLTLAGT